MKLIKVDDSVHEELKGLARQRGISVGRVVFQMLRGKEEAESLSDRVLYLEEEMERVRKYLESATGGTYA
jgi:macrodomain Ter protein organizer (MatP/YcbG family)